MSDIPSEISGELIAFRFEGRIPVGKIADLHYLIGAMGCWETTQLSIGGTVTLESEQPKKEAKKGGRPKLTEKYLLEEVEGDFYISRRSFASFATPPTEDPTYSGARTRAYRGFDIIATHLVEQHIDHQNCDCPLKGIYVPPTIQRRDDPNISKYVFIEPGSFREAVEGSEDGLASFLGDVSTHPEALGALADPTQHRLGRSAMWPVIKTFSDALNKPDDEAKEIIPAEES